VNGHLPTLLRWLKEEGPDVACLQEIRAPDEKFPHQAIEGLGYSVLWHGQPRWNGVAILARGRDIRETRRGLPGDPDDTHSRYIEAAVDDIVIGCLYLPNGNGPAPKFDYKLRWFRRLQSHAAALLKSGQAVVLAGDYNVVPTDLDAVVPQRWIYDAVFQPQSKQAYADLLRQGWTDAIRHLHPEERIYTYWDFYYGRPDWDSGLRMDHLLVSPQLTSRLKAAGVDRAVRTWEKTSDHAPAWIQLT
jgi:exodeoxyribonuclease-3